MKTKLVMVALLGTVLFSCSPKVAPAPSPAPSPVATASVMTPELAAGQSLYENNCAKCHKLFDRHEFTAEQWTPITMSMAKKAKISEEDRQKIYNYLTMK